MSSMKFTVKRPTSTLLHASIMFGVSQRPYADASLAVGGWRCHDGVAMQTEMQLFCLSARKTASNDGVTSVVHKKSAADVALADVTATERFENSFATAPGKSRQNPEKNIYWRAAGFYVMSFFTGHRHSCFSYV
jgi:hypothetical protein